MACEALRLWRRVRGVKYVALPTAASVPARPRGSVLAMSTRLNVCVNCRNMDRRADDSRRPLARCQFGQMFARIDLAVLDLARSLGKSPLASIEALRVNRVCRGRLCARQTVCRGRLCRGTLHLSTDCGRENACARPSTYVRVSVRPRTRCRSRHRRERRLRCRSRRAERVFRMPRRGERPQSSCRLPRYQPRQRRSRR